MPCIDRVLVVGAGIAGLALAHKLGSMGIAVDILERRPGPGSQGAGILLTGNAVRVFHELGLGQTLVERGRRVRVIRFTDTRERELFRVYCSGQPGWPEFVSIQREALQRILLGSVLPVVPRWGVTLASLYESGDGVEATLSDGTRARYGLVVGADGVHSELRRLLFGGPSIDPIKGFCGWRFLAKCPARLDAPQYMLGNGRTLLLHPLPGGEVYCGAGPVTEAILEGASDLERIRGAYSTFGGCAAEVLASVTASTTLIPTRYWHLERRPWSAGSSVLIGDAAHPCAPALAQGGAMALEDAIVLGELIGGDARLADVLAAFEARRAPRVAHAQAESLRRMTANQPLDSRGLALRDSTLIKVGAARLLDAWAPLMEASP